MTAIPLHATVPEGWFEWPACEPLAGSALDASDMNEAPAGAKGRVRVEGSQFVTADGKRLRLWGANLCAAQNFPDTPAEAKLIATRLARGGVNIVRLHHLDNQWGVQYGQSLWPANRADHSELDAGQLDKLHRLMAELRAVGIYSNLNLKVSKTLSEADGFPPSIVEAKDFNKRVDMFQRRMIDLQKDYARRLLTTKNPYTGLSPVEDPSVAVIELNNENSLLGFWTRDLGRGTHRFPEPFRTELKDLWNAWLARRHASDEALRKAWSEGAGTLGASVLPSSKDWHITTQRGSTITAKRSHGDTVTVLEIKGATGTDWHSQASLGELRLEDGVAYTVELDAFADKERQINVVVGLGLDEGKAGVPWRSMGLYDPLTLGTEPRVQRLSFVAHSVAGEPARLSLNVGQMDGHITVRSLRIAPGALGGGLREGQSPAARSVPIPQEASSAQWADWIHFLADTERAWADELRDFLVNDLKVRAPMVGSQVEYGAITGMNREQRMEFADSHVYWQHPDFSSTTGMWDPKAWTIRNTSQLAEYGERAFGEIGALAMLRVADKPYTVSEYDHPAPSEYVCEMYPVVSTFAARQDWDGIYPFAVDEYGSKDTDGRIMSFFDQHHHPAKWGFSPAASRVFRHGLVAAAPRATLHLGSPLWAESPHTDILWRKAWGPGRITFLDTALGVSDKPGKPGIPASITRHGAASGSPLAVRQDKGGVVYVAADRSVAVLSGHIGGTTQTAGALQVTCGNFGRNFASVMAVALDEAPLSGSARILVTLAGRAENQDMGWNELRTSVGDKWGHGPTIAERVPAEFALTVDGPRKVFALAPDGSRAAEVASCKEKGVLWWSVSEKDRTLHYEIIAQ